MKTIRPLLQNKRWVIFPFLKGFWEDKPPKIFGLDAINYELLLIIEKISVQIICTFSEDFFKIPWTSRFAHMIQLVILYRLNILIKSFHWVGPCANLTAVSHYRYPIISLSLKWNFTKKFQTFSFNLKVKLKYQNIGFDFLLWFRWRPYYKGAPVQARSARHRAHVDLHKRCGFRTYNLKGGPLLFKKRNSFMQFYQIPIHGLKLYILNKKCSAYFCGRCI